MESLGGKVCRTCWAKNWLHLSTSKHLPCLLILAFGKLVGKARISWVNPLGSKLVNDSRTCEPPWCLALWPSLIWDNELPKFWFSSPFESEFRMELQPLRDRKVGERLLLKSIPSPVSENVEGISISQVLVKSFSEWSKASATSVRFPAPSKWEELPDKSLKSASPAPPSSELWLDPLAIPWPWEILDGPRGIGWDPTKAPLRFPRETLAREEENRLETEILAFEEEGIEKEWKLEWV